MLKKSHRAKLVSGDSLFCMHEVPGSSSTTQRINTWANEQIYTEQTFHREQHTNQTGDNALVIKKHTKKVKSIFFGNMNFLNLEIKVFENWL